MFQLPAQFILFDTEYTSWEGAEERDWSKPGEYRELVQIGAIRVDGGSLTEVEELTIFVQPRLNPELSDYFVNLTGITQERIEKKGISFEMGLEEFFVWSKQDILFSYGGDEKILQENCALYKVDFPFALTCFQDVRKIFESGGIDTSAQTSGNIMRAFGKEPSRRAHNALSDVRELLDGLRFLYKNLR